jgi:gluconate 5-dehydrogenase
LREIFVSTTPHERTVAQLFDLSGKTALVTGGTGHLGSAMSRALAEAGASVVVTSPDAQRAERAAAALPRVGQARHQGISLDYFRSESLEASFREALRPTGGIDILVNNGHIAEPHDWTQVTAEQFARQLANATGYFVLSRLVREHVVARGQSASIIMLGSMYGQVGSYPDAYEGIGSASPAAYHALKGGIIQLTRHLAVYWANDRVRVNCLSPGPFPSAAVPAMLVERLKTKLPMKRMGAPWELKGAIVFLASDASTFMTGQNLVIDGGWTAW